MGISLIEWTGHWSTPKRYVTKGHTKAAPATGGWRRYTSPLVIMAQTVRAILLASATATSLRGLRCEQLQQPFRGLLVSWPDGEPDHGGRSGHQQSAQPFIAGAADPAHALLAAGRMLLRRQADPGRQVAAGFEFRRIDLGRKRQRDDHTDARDGGQ